MCHACCLAITTSSSQKQGNVTFSCCYFWEFDLEVQHKRLIHTTYIKTTRPTSVYLTLLLLQLFEIYGLGIRKHDTFNQYNCRASVNFERIETEAMTTFTTMCVVILSTNEAHCEMGTWVTSLKPKQCTHSSHHDPDVDLVSIMMCCFDPWQQRVHPRFFETWQMKSKTDLKSWSPALEDFLRIHRHTCTDQSVFAGPSSQLVGRNALKCSNRWGNTLSQEQETLQVKAAHPSHDTGRNRMNACCAHYRSA